MSDLEYITDEPPNAAVPLGALDGAPSPGPGIPTQQLPHPRASVPAEVEVLMPGLPTQTLSTNIVGAGPGGDGDGPRMRQRAVADEAAGNRSGMGSRGRAPVRIGGYGSSTRWGWVPDGVVDLVLTGSDQGTVWPEGDINYQFSVPIERMQDGSALLVTAGATRRWGSSTAGRFDL